MSSAINRRVLVIDDNESIHEDFRKILQPKAAPSTALADARAAFLGGGGAPAPAAAAQESSAPFELTSALQGEEGYQRLCAACDVGEPFAMAFVDMRMPPGWDGVQTIAKLWERDPELQVVVCTAYSDYTWDETISQLGQSDRLLILKKPFDAIEIQQLAAALTEKWNTKAHERALLEDVRRAEAEARAYAASLETVNQTLVTAKAAADMAADLKTEFLVRLTDEVHQRLAEVLGSVELLATPDADDASRSQLEQVLDVGRHLLRTINEILDVTTLERGESELDVDACKPLPLLEDVLDAVRPAAEAKGLQLDCEVVGELPERIHTDERHLRRLLETLIENAVHYTDAGSVTVRASLASTSNWKRPHLRFEVSDTGQGIPRERLGSIFEPTARAGDATGYGFGLALAKRLAAVLGGDLVARSEPGRGSSFELTVEALSPEPSEPTELAA